MELLPWDVISKIYNFRKHELSNTCTFLNQQFKSEKVHNTIKIQRWYRKYFVIDMDDWSKRRLVHAYKTSYEWEYFKTYPTFLAKKCTRPDLIEKAKYAESCNTRKAIVDFLMDPSVLKEEIHYAGW